MKKLAIILAGAALAACATTAPAETRVEKGEAKLAKMLEGYEQSGEPTSCINAPRSTRLEVIDYVGVVYDAGDTIYVSRPSDPRSLGRNDVLIVERSTSQLCKQDVTHTIDQTLGHVSGVVFLGDFVPYKRVSDAG